MYYRIKLVKICNAAFESGDLIFTCTMLYPEHFDALRRTYGCGESIIRSLARCVKWKANGGKSGSAFLKTRGKTSRYAGATMSYHLTSR